MYNTTQYEYIDGKEHSVLYYGTTIDEQIKRSKNFTGEESLIRSVKTSMENYHITNNPDNTFITTFTYSLPGYGENKYVINPQLDGIRTIKIGYQFDIYARNLVKNKDKGKIATITDSNKINQPYYQDYNYTIYK